LRGTLEVEGQFKLLKELKEIVVTAINGSALGGEPEKTEDCMLRVSVNHFRLIHYKVRISTVAGFG